MSTEQGNAQALPTSYPNLRTVIQEKRLFLVGGLPITEKLRLLKKRYGIEAEWLGVESAYTKIDSVVRKVRYGNAGAVILLEAFMSHRVSGAVVEACNQVGVPWAYGDRAGIGNLTAALDELESKSARTVSRRMNG